MVAEGGSAAPAAGTTQPPALDFLPCHQSHPFLDEKAFNEVQVEQEVVLEELCVEEAATSLPPRSLQLMLSRRQPPFSPAS